MKSSSLPTGSGSAISILLFLGLFSSCKIDKYLGENEHIVASNKIKIQNVENRRTRVALETDLATLYKQKDLPDILIGKTKSSAWLWFRFNEKNLEKDTLRGVKKWFYKSFASQPTLYDSSASAITVRNMEQYLKNIGYLHPKVVEDHDYRNKKSSKGLADISYTVYPRTLYVIDTTYFVCNDTKIQYLLDDLSGSTFLARGKPLDLRLFEQEKQRITTALNNSGYASFTPNYISQLAADTSKQSAKVKLTLTVQTPNGSLSHRKYQIGTISIYPAFEAIRGDSMSFDTLIFDKKRFITEGGKSELKVAALSNAIPLKQDSVYSKEKNDQTIRQLTNLGIYKFVNIKPGFDENDTSAISYKIYLTPDEKMSYDGGVELNYSNINLSNGASRLGRLGLATDLGFSHRNLFGGAEHFTSRFSAGLDRSLSSNKGITQKNGFSFDIRFDNTLSIPKFINFSNSWLFFTKLHLIKADFYKDLKENANSDLTSSYVFSDRLFLDLYRLQQFNLGTRYVLKRKNGSEQFVINPTGIELQLSKLTENFNSLADERLRRSLNTQLMTGFIARSMTHERSGKTNAIGERWQFLTHIEQSGLEILGLEQLFNKGDAFKLTDDLSFSKFLRGEIDVRYNRQLSAKRLFAGRLAFGIAKSLDNAPVPYSRQFFVGGPNSIRGWVIRDIGPGGYHDFSRDSAPTKTFPFQAGDIKLEFNSEYRFPLFWRLYSAILFDAGNIWNLKKDDKLPNGNIDKFWIDQIAISSGIGLRFDVDYATIRFDFGFKLREPFERNGTNWIPMDEYSWKRNVNPNFALGFPF